ncbi:UDP-N-acetylmuramate--L-alanine ligase [Gossypium arboreum]|uniref:UDP-N-acetylmuramate--L-alanine ligase n=1 Tax=Gossypium arboreum TaxID=29729 RepID=A0A0B0PPC7_GOSAR|nr:UDP-N-acetylmuramate--L-alanine ligase [Gossypium arboreum]
MVRPLYTEENKGERTPHLLLASISTTGKKISATQPQVRQSRLRNLLSNSDVCEGDEDFSRYFIKVRMLLACVRGAGVAYEGCGVAAGRWGVRRPGVARLLMRVAPQGGSA